MIHGWKNTLIRIGLTAAAFGGFTAPAQASDFCFHKGGDSYVTATEARDQAKMCLVETHWWVAGYSGVSVSRINGTAFRFQEVGWNLNPHGVVDWDSAAENSQPGRPLPGGYWITVQ